MKSLNNILYIDLSKKKAWIEERKDLFEEFLGGSGVAAKLYKELVTRNIDPFDPENPIIFAVGPFNAVYPMASKTVAAFKSPLINRYAESHAGGRTSTSIRLCGLGAIVITGESEKPIYIVIKNGKVFFRDARALWGMQNSITVARVIREREGGAGVRSIMRIGKAGERLVRYACVITETYRHFGRLGLGAIFGAKKLKALVVAGNRSIKIPEGAYKNVYDRIFEMAVKSDAAKKYHEIGTAINVKHLNEIGALPTMNLKKTRFEYADYISGEYLLENKLGRRVSCSGCPVACIHIAALRQVYREDPYFYKTTFVSYDYEPIYALGSMLGVSNPDGMLKLIEVVDLLGLDAMSTGVALAWATEALEKGIVTTRETIISLKWGDFENYIKACEYVVEQPNDFYAILAKGIEEASKVYGGGEFALSFGGNEMPGYATGYAGFIGYLIGIRHSHLDNAGYSYDQKLLKSGQNIPPETLVDMLINEEQWRQVLSNLVVCFFARKIYTPELVVTALSAIGREMSEGDLKKVGEETYKMKIRIKKEERYDPLKLRIPRRILEVETPFGRLDEEYIRRALEYFKSKIEPF